MGRYGCQMGHHRQPLDDDLDALIGVPKASEIEGANSMDKAALASGRAARMVALDIALDGSARRGLSS